MHSIREMCCSSIIHQETQLFKVTTSNSVKNCSFLLFWVVTQRNAVLGRIFAWQANELDSFEIFLRELTNYIFFNCSIFSTELLRDTFISARVRCRSWLKSNECHCLSLVTVTLKRLKRCRSSPSNLDLSFSFFLCLCFCSSIESLTVRRDSFFCVKLSLSRSSNLSLNKRERPCLTTFPNTDERVENKTRSGVFLTNFEVFGNVVKHCLESLIYLFNWN